jgi:hypothetical protein
MRRRRQDRRVRGLDERWLLRHAHALADEKYVFRKDAGFAVLMD